MTEVKELKVEDIKKTAEEKGCPVQKAHYYITEFLSGPMCGRCFPCAMGSYEARIRLQRIVDGNGVDGDLLALRRIAEQMAEGSLCKKGKDTAKFILEWMGTNVYEEHINGRCLSRDCVAFIEYRIIPEKCIMCGLCKDACKYGAILGEKKETYKSGYLPFEIRQKRCVKCGECIEVCPTEAIIIVEPRVKEPVGV
ncbi:MAG: 4Fe-4S binding protein [Nitrospiraceae bacterium]|nr:4Fe-4S binding protein [Nitrospiraceae bacterium]